MVEEQVRHFIVQNNRPFNAQVVADHLAQYGLKKGPIQKALDSLSEANKITCKEFGKTKIYCAIQDSSNLLSKEEMDAKTSRAAELTLEVTTTGESVRDLKKDLKSLQSTMTMEELEACNQDLQKQIDLQASKLAELRSGGPLIPAAEKAAIEKAFADVMSHWDKRKRIFKNIWDSVSENVDGKQTDLFEEIGIDTDEMVDQDYKSLQRLLSKRAKT